jgi:hypothetical protein
VLPIRSRLDQYWKQVKIAAQANNSAGRVAQIRGAVEHGALESARHMMRHRPVSVTNHGLIAGT